jgi:DNA-damage-inducible protein D
MAMSGKNVEEAGSSIFENIKKINEFGEQYWSAREFYRVLEYVKWEKFLNVIDKAKESCINSGQNPEDHFPHMKKMVQLG